MEGFSICEFNGEGQIAEVWQQWDRHGMRQQLGARNIAGTVVN